MRKLSRYDLSSLIFIVKINLCNNYCAFQESLMRSLRVLVCCLIASALVGFALKPNTISKDYSHKAAEIIGSAMVEDQAYDKLEYLTDSIGNRLSGSAQLDKAIQWALAQMKADGLENVHLE